MNVDASSTRCLSTRISSGIAAAVGGGLVAELIHIVLLRDRPDEGFYAEDGIAVGLGILVGTYIAVTVGEIRLKGKPLHIVRGAVIGTMGGSIVSMFLGAVLVGSRLVTSDAMGTIIVLSSSVGLILGSLIGRITAGGRLTLRELSIVMVVVALVCGVVSRFAHLH